MENSEKHSAFVVIDGINTLMKCYEYIAMDIVEYDVQVVVQHDGEKGYIGFVYSED